ncbi:serine/threonine protein kinase, putative [Metarhizium acridum CQMa 102]|uniref:non-specific serine/threonine protein kinase n=1 Tax=Metarhizium acridum (strain CQMa 102) TaxID=655827 RepID=E9DTT6_METAQ|nr:serine/threonine protein kinase, putative [Metarhizium acridum CQMa 102]EFY92796.1 serine/threonine protein kinase, putative [Metarhizium acridum CQMa 102]
MAQFVLDLVYSLGNCLNCFPGSPTLKINSRSFKILRLLGEGGFSYVYLVEDAATHELFALKKIRCPFGAESVQQAMREVDAYRLFAHIPTIISAVDHAVATERGADEATKTVYVLLPYYRRGNLQDMINANLVNRGSFPERHLMTLFLGVCKALRSMHEYQAPPAERMEMGNEEDVPGANSRSGTGSKMGTRGKRTEADEEEDQERPLMESENRVSAAGGRVRASSPAERMEMGNEEDVPGANSRSGTGSKMGTRGKRTEADEEEDQERPLMESENRVSAAGGRIRSYAHRDIKPGNIMIDDSGSTPILMDLGSVAPSPIPVTSQSVALQIQDTAAEHSTMPYRAPELFDVHTGSVIDTKTDIWSLGCTLYACLVGKSPFEMRSDETGGTLSLCVLGGDWRFPDETPGGAKRVNTISQAKARAASGDHSAASASEAPNPTISEPIRNIVRQCLKVEPAERPDINELISMVEGVIEDLPDEGGL